jgi:hypothetical protein
MIVIMIINAYSTGPNVIKLYRPQLTKFRNKLECLSLAGLTSVV